MPSYRAILPVEDLLPGHGPEEVMDSAVTAVSQGATVEQTDIQIVTGVPQIVVRFHLAEGDPFAVARSMRAAVEAVATTGPGRLLRRYGGRWLPARR